jgi:hypothetical protein
MIHGVRCREFQRPVQGIYRMHQGRSGFQSRGNDENITGTYIGSQPFAAFCKPRTDLNRQGRIALRLSALRLPLVRAGEVIE